MGARKHSNAANAAALAVLVGLLGCAPGQQHPGTREVTRPYDDGPALLGDFRGHVDELGVLHFDDFAPSAALIEAAGREGVAVEALTSLTRFAGLGRGNNPPDTYELVTCTPATSPPCEGQYGPRISLGFGDEPARCGTTPAGRSSRCYAADVELRAFYGATVEISNSYVQFSGFTSSGAPYDLQVYGGSAPVLGIASPLGDIYRYGTLEGVAGWPGPGAPPTATLDAPYHQASLRRWRFSLPVGVTEDPAFGFGGSVFGTISTVSRAPHQVSVREGGAPTSDAVSRGCTTSTGDLTVVASDDALLASHPAGTTQVYLVRRRTGEVTLLSAASDGTPGNGHSEHPCITPDGASVVFESSASNLVSTDTNGVTDVFVRNVASGTTTLVSRSGATEATDCGRGGGSERGALSDNGLYVAFSSTCASLCGGSDMVTGCFAGRRQVYRSEVATGTLEGISVRDGSSPTIDETTRWGGAGAPLSAGTHNSHLGGISGDGSRVVFVSTAHGVGALGSDASDTATRDVFVRIISSATTTRITDDRGGAIGSRNAQISADSVWVVFESASPTLLGSSDTNGSVDIFRCLATGGMCRAVSSPDGTGSLGADGSSGFPSISTDGGLVAFESAATNLVAGDGNGVSDVFVRDFGGAGVSVRRVSVNGDGAEGDDASGRPFITRTGDYVLFESTAENLQADPFGDFDEDLGALDVFMVRR